MLAQKKAHAKKLAREQNRRDAKQRKALAVQRQNERARHPKASPIMEMLIQAQLKRFHEKFGRYPSNGDPLFFDPKETEPKAIKPDDEEAIRATADATGCRLELVGALVRGGLVIRGGGDTCVDPS